MAREISKTRVSELGPSWPSCLLLPYVQSCRCTYSPKSYTGRLTKLGPICRTVWTLLIPSPNKPRILRVSSTRLLKTLCEKEKLLVTSNFSFSHSVFYPFGELSVVFIKFEIVVSRLFKFKKSLNF